ncbi:MAG: hypothetical protein A3K46_07425 [Chloroflexi bacterium RBG_13_60_9]|nr:MAG: hypothetical protein A3K46_07425 [Chloroflexi bacterium RBG_13_60_9]
MDILFILKVVCALATVATGGISLFAPRAIKGFTGLEATGPRGITEIRAVMGGLFVGLGLAPFLLPVAQVYQALGIMYLAIAAVRTVSMLLDRSVMQSNIISLIVEIVFGIILVV